MADVVRWGDPQPAACSLSQGGHREISSCGPPCVENMQPLQNGGHSGVKGSTFTGPWVSGLPCLTFGVVALHQARLSDLYVEGFVLLVLLIVDYFHLDGFTEEEEEGEEGKEEEEERKEVRKARKWQTGNWKTERKTGKSSIWFPHKHLKLIFQGAVFFNFNTSSDQVTRENSVLIIKRLFSLHHHPQSTSFKPDIWCQIKLWCYLSSSHASKETDLINCALCQLVVLTKAQFSLLLQPDIRAFGKKQKLQSRGWTVYQLY